jgi:hypothetical protein
MHGLPSPGTSISNVHFFSHECDLEHVSCRHKAAGDDQNTRGYCEKRICLMLGDEYDASAATQNKYLAYRVKAIGQENSMYAQAGSYRSHTKRNEPGSKRFGSNRVRAEERYKRKKSEPAKKICMHGFNV